MATTPSTAPALAILGCGNMGRAILQGALRAGVVRAAEVLVVDPAEAARTWAASLGAGVSESPAAAAGAVRLLLAVKPQSFRELAAALSPRAGCTCISVMGGWRADDVGAALGGRVHVARAMPNTPASIGLGVTALAFQPGLGAAERAWVERLFSSVGRTVSVEESLFDAVTAVSGSGPAYLFLLAEAELRAARELGLPPEAARALVSQTLVGAAAMVAAGERDPAALREAVTSRGGTTAAALEVLAARGVVDAIVAAIRAAAVRGAELGAGAVRNPGA